MSGTRPGTVTPASSVGHTARRPAGALAAGPPADPATITRWRARLDALTHWCLSELPLAPAVAGVVAGGRPTLGDLLRRALGRDGAGVVDLLDALDAPNTAAARALLGRVLGADLLLVVVTLRGGAIARADARACRTHAEAGALVDAFLGRTAPRWAATGGVTALANTLSPTLTQSIDGANLSGITPPLTRQLGADHAGTIILPFLPLDGRPAVAEVVPAEPAPPAPPAIPAFLGGSLRAGSAFLEADVAHGDVEVEDAEDRDDEDAADDADESPETWDDPNTGREQEAEPEEDAPPEDAAPEEAPQRAPQKATPERARYDDARHDDAEEDAPAPVDAAATLDRLRARTSAASDRVPALIATDDGGAEHVADAAAWLAEASEQELRALVRGDWSGDTAIEAALAVAADDPEADEVMQWARRHEAEIVVEIDGAAAAAWLRRHRPDVAARLAAVL